MRLKIGGVPEHFNLPWHLMLESGELKKESIHMTWQDFPGGTGAMVEALNSNTVDMAMLLTEGAVAGISRGGDYKMLSFYVSSPLVWGIHVPAHSNLFSINDLKGKRYAISRFGSGSHLMSYVHADMQEWPLDKLKFVVIDNLEGARTAFAANKAEIFLWEKFTSKPYVDNGEFRLIGECPTPYPCFTICVANKALKKNPKAIRMVVTKVQEFAKELAGNAESSKLISKRYGLLQKDVEEWLGMTRWAEDLRMDKEVVEKVVSTLQKLNLIEDHIHFNDLVANLDEYKNQM